MNDSMTGQRRAIGVALLVALAVLVPPPGSVALALNWTVRPGAPLVALAESVITGPCPGGGWGARMGWKEAGVNS